MRGCCWHEKECAVDGSDISEMVLRSYGGGRGDLSRVVNRVNLATLDRLYIPVGIPEEYELYRIIVLERSISFAFLPERYSISPHTAQMSIDTGLHFHFHISRFQDVDAARDGFFTQNRTLEDDLITGIYHFCERRDFFDWMSKSWRLQMRFPRNYLDSYYISADPSVLTQYAVIRTIDLLDDVAINEFLAELRAEVEYDYDLDDATD